MTLVPVAEVQAAIVSGVEPLDVETVSIYEAAGRILAKDLRAKLTQPPFAASAMDGYAVRAADIAFIPACLKVIGSSAAGHGFNGEAVRIFTGAPVPAGADTVVIQEDTQAAGDGTVEILEPAFLGH
jgi:molybdopterin molybdotransferase